MFFVLTSFFGKLSYSRPKDKDIHDHTSKWTLSMINNDQNCHGVSIISKMNELGSSKFSEGNYWRKKWNSSQIPWSQNLVTELERDFTFSLTKYPTFGSSPLPQEMGIGISLFSWMTCGIKLNQRLRSFFQTI